MPTLVNAINADWFGAAISGGTSPGASFTSTNSGYGATYDTKTLLQAIPLQHLMQFEPELPAGVNVTGVRLIMERRSNVGASLRFRGGIIARDGAWDVTGLNVTSYPTFTALPTPVRRPLSVYVYYDDLWHDGAAAAVDQTHAASGSGSYSVGEGGSPTYTQAGWIAHVQSFLDATTGTHRGFSASTTAIPMLFCLTAGEPLNQDMVQYTYGIATATVGFRPVLEIDYEVPNDLPVVTILNPAAPISVNDREAVFFRATSIDTEDGDISAAIIWDSDLDGAGLATGSALSLDTLSVGAHTITARSIDSGALVGTDTIAVAVVANPLDGDAEISASRTANAELRASATLDAEISGSDT